jgi:hypothetical protein
VLGLTVAGGALAAAGTDTGPSTTTDPYMAPVADGVTVTSLLTVKNGTDAGQASNGYAMVGIPDGLGAFDGPKGRDFNLIVNHELRSSAPLQGVPRRHGQAGAFDSIWTIDFKTLEVEEGADLIDPGVRYWDYTTHSYTSAPTPPFLDPMGRLCAGFLSNPGQLYNEKTGRGYDGQLYFANEENGDNGRDFGVTLDGQAQQLSRLGLFVGELARRPEPGRRDVRAGPGGRERDGQRTARLHRPQAPSRERVRPGRPDERPPVRRRSRERGRDERRPVPLHVRHEQPGAVRARA